MNIWAQYKNQEPDKIEEGVAKADLGYLLQEYRIAYQNTGTVVWAGLKRDAPNPWRY